MAAQKVYLIPQRKMNKVVSHLKPVNNAVRGVAQEISIIAEGRLAPHRKTGAAHIEVSHGKVDSYVSLVDKAALSIEFGHYMGRESLGTTRTFVRGLHLFIDWYHDGVL
jgi:hypothetical protein